MSERSFLTVTAQSRRFMRHSLNVTVMIRIVLVLLFAALGPFFGLLSFIFAFFGLRMFLNQNLMHDEFFSFETISLVYAVGIIPALIVGIFAGSAAEANGRCSLKRTLFSSATVGTLMSLPLLFLRYHVPPQSIFERLEPVAMVIWVNVGAAILSWLSWALARRAVLMVWKEREA